MVGEVVENNNHFGLIYKVENLTNGKIYIGQTVYTIEKRRSEHECWALKSYKKGIVFYSAIRKYGKNSFKWEVIDYANSQDELNNKEIFWIDYYKSYISRYDSNGYNMTLGGEGRAGYTHSEETKNKIRESNMKRMLEDGTHFSKSVLKFSLDGKLIAKYDSAKEGAESVGCNQQNVTDCCRDYRQKTAYGYIWIYEEDYTEDLLKERINNLPKQNHKPRSISQFDLNGNLINTFPSAYQASKKTNSDRSAIIKCCKGKFSRHNGFIWRYTNK